MSKPISQEIKDFLQEYSLTQEQLAFECDLTQGAINRAVNGKGTQKPETIAKIKNGMKQIKELVKQGYKV